MTKGVSWFRSVGFKLAAIAAVLLALSLALILADFYTLSSMQGDAASMALFAAGRMYQFQVLNDCNSLAGDGIGDPKALREELDAVVQKSDERYRDLLQGDATRGIPALA